MKRIITSLFLLAIAASNAQEKPIKPTELPKPATEFLALYFKNNAIHHAIKDTDKTKVTYEVMLADGTEAEFTETGAWKEVDGQGKAIPTAFIPVGITSYVKTNYGKEKITHIDKGLRDIDIDLSNKVELEFDLAGKFLRIDK